MKVLLTGSSGFIGTHVLKQLLKQGHKVICLGRTKPELESSNVEWKYCDMHAFQGFDFDLPEHLIHLAWKNLPNYNEDFHINENLSAQKNFLNLAIQAGVKNLTVAGTCLEYGLQEGELHEELDCNPTVPYAMAKQKLRQYLEGLQSDFSISLKWLRLFYMYGEGQSPRSIIPLLHKAVEDGEKTFKMSGGEQIRDYSRVEDMASYIVKSAMQSEVNGIINCGSGLGIPLKDFIFEYIEKNKLDIELELGHYPYNKYEPMSFWSRTEKLKKI